MDPVLAVVIVAGVVIVAFARVRLKPGIGPKPPKVLGVGWQFYPHPTTLEPPGTVFRIGKDGRRSIVATLDLVPNVGAEAHGRHRELREAHMGMIARLAGLGGVDVSTSKTETLIFELDQPKREYVDDKELDRVLASQVIEQRPPDRYFIIRESLSARAITYRLEATLVQQLGGEAKVSEAAEFKGTFQASRSEGSFTLEAQFDTHYRVMFLPEELRLPASEGVAASDLGRTKVEAPLVWRDPRQTDLDFVLDELLIPLARRLGPPWLAAVEGLVATALPRSLSRLVDVARAEDSGGRPDALREARAELVAHVECNPSFERDLGRIARHVTVAVGSDADEDVKRLEGYWAKLTFAFDRVHRLDRPVALRGFFNSEQCVTVVDCRGKYGSLTLPDRPARRPAHDEAAPEIGLATFADGVHDDFAIGRPRVWILRTDTNEERDGLAVDLDRQFARPSERLPDPRFFANKLPSAPPAELVSAITRGAVHIAGPCPPASDPSASVAESVMRLLASTSKDPRDDHPFYEIGSREGINRLLGDLERQLRERWEHDRDWS